MVNKIVNLLLKNNVIIEAWWDKKDYCWRKNISNEAIKAECVVGFTELGFSFPKKETL